MTLSEIKTTPLFSQITTLKSAHAVEGNALPWEWLGIGIAYGMAMVFFLGLLFGSKSLKRSVWVSQLCFVALGAASLSWAFFCQNMLSKGNADVFAFLIRLQLGFSTVTTFNLVRPTSSKQSFGAFYSAFLGAILSASLLNFLWPINGALFISELILISASLYLGGRTLFGGQRDGFGERTLFLQLTTVLLMGFLYFWLPDFEKIQSTSLSVFASLTAMLFVTSGATLLSSARERTDQIVSRLQRELYGSDRRLGQQLQVSRSLSNDLLQVQEQLRDEVRMHRKDSIRDHLRIRSLEESSQDIAHGLLSHIKELVEDCQLVVSESRSPKYRLSFIKAHAERTHHLATRVRNMAGFLLSTEAANEVGRDKIVTLNPGDLLKECLFLCSDKFRRVGVEIEIQSLENDLLVEGKAALLAQGFLGLIYNALEATATADVRRVTLVLRKVEDGGQSWVELGISNSGPGIPTSVKAKAFQLKERDGLGIHSLGLSMAFGIFEHAGGSLSLDNEAVATTLLARLPLAQNPEDSSLRLVI